MKAVESLAQDADAVEPSRNVLPVAHELEDGAGTTLVLPRVRAAKPDLDDRKDVRELQAMIEQAFAMLDEAADAEGGAATAVPAPMPSDVPRVLGAAAGSELTYRPSWASRIFKTFAGTAIVVAVGLVPLQRVTTPVSSEAFVDAPVYALRAPIDGVIRNGQLIVGALVESGIPLALIESPKGSGHDIAVASPGSGKVWNVLFRSGDRVARGDVIARVVSCSASRVTATVSESVYDKLKPGMAARFNFFGSSHFFHGTVAALLGHADGTGNSAIASANLARNAYRVVVSMSDLSPITNCAVGRRGTVVFGRQAR